jgi:hypothetical protein
MSGVAQMNSTDGSTIFKDGILLTKEVTTPDQYYRPYLFRDVAVILVTDLGDDEGDHEPCP